MWNTPTKKRLDKIPRLYETENIPLKDKKVYLHFFVAGSDWYIVEYDGKNTFFGYAILNSDYEMAEWGYISFRELRELRVAFMEVDCEKESWFPIQKVSQIEKIMRG